MCGNHFLFCLFGIFLACFLDSTEAVIGGTLITDPHLMPYQVSLQNSKNQHVCGAGVIRDQFVITAARCVLDHIGRQLLGMSIVANTSDLRDGGHRIAVDKIFASHEFDRADNNGRIGDIAVLKLKKRLSHPKRNESNQWIRMPPKYFEKRAVIAGYGWNVIHPSNNTSYPEESGSSDGQLRYNIVRTVFTKECQRYYPRESLDEDRHICAQILPIFPSQKTSPSGACKGDTGGLLVLEDHYVDEHAILVGVLSKYVGGCDERHHPAIYTSVSHYRQFILNTIANSEICKGGKQ